MYGNIPVEPYVPFLVFFIKKPLAQILWMGFACGTIVDLLGSSPFGLFALLYTLLGLVLNYMQKYLDEQKALIYCLITFISSVCFSFFHLVALNLIEKDFSIRFSSFISEMLFYCPLDVIYGISFLYFPIFLVEKIRKIPFKKLLKRKRRARS